MQQLPPLDSPQRLSRGCLLPLVGGLWVLTVSMIVPISADWYTAPPWLKLVVTVGHLAAIAVMLYPFRGKAVGTRDAAKLVSLVAGLQVLVLWYWN
jgi:hypothetical protein